MREIDNFFLQKEEPVKSCLLFLREHILKHDENIIEQWKYNQAPFYCYRGKVFCYLWVHKKSGFPYLGIIEGRKIDHPALIVEGRTQVRIMRFNPNEDMPIELINSILTIAIGLYNLN